MQHHRRWTRRIPVFNTHYLLAYLTANFHFDLGVVHTGGHVRDVVNSAITPVINPSVTAIGFLDLRSRYSRLLVTIAAIGPNESHVFIVEGRNVDVELIDSVNDELDIGPSELQ